MQVNYDARWFQLYRNALLEDDPSTAKRNVDSAMAAIAERLSEQVGSAEREALTVAQHYLDLLKSVELRFAA
jgi:hypothetical protein